MKIKANNPHITQPLAGIIFYIMTHKMRTLEDMLDNSDYDPVIWEDVKQVTDELEGKIDSVSKEYESLLDDFCDLLQIIMDDNGIPQSMKNSIQTRFINKQKQNEDGKSE